MALQTVGEKVKRNVERGTHSDTQTRSKTKDAAEDVDQLIFLTAEMCWSREAERGIPFWGRVVINTTVLPSGVAEVGKSSKLSRSKRKALEAKRSRDGVGRGKWTPQYELVQYTLR
jgi:hypothetical protein